MAIYYLLVIYFPQILFRLRYATISVLWLVSFVYLFYSCCVWPLNLQQILFESERRVKRSMFLALGLGSFWVKPCEILTKKLLRVGFINSVSTIWMIWTLGKVFAIVLGFCCYEVILLWVHSHYNYIVMVSK